MLVLSRRQGESIVVNDNIFVTVLQIDGDTVRIGIDAPDETLGHRDEIIARIERSQTPGQADSGDRRMALD